jgi:hypothetical protein
LKFEGIKTRIEFPRFLTHTAVSPNHDQQQTERYTPFHTKPITKKFMERVKKARIAKNH